MQARTCAINHLKALVVNAPERLRQQLRALATDQLLARCARLRSHPTQPIEYRATIAALRRTAQRSLALQPKLTISTLSSTRSSAGARRGCWLSRASG